MPCQWVPALTFTCTNCQMSNSRTIFMITIISFIISVPKIMRIINIPIPVNYTSALPMVSNGMMRRTSNGSQAPVGP